MLVPFIEVITSKNGMFQVDLDVHGFGPQDINITVTDDKTLTVSGKYEEKSDDGLLFSSRSFSRSFSISKEVQVQDFKSKLAKDGKILRIEAPVKREKKEKIEGPKNVSIEINHVKTPAVGQ